MTKLDTGMAVARVLGNPYAVTAAALSDAHDHLLRVDLKAHAQPLLAGADPERSVRLLVAVALAQARSDATGAGRFQVSGALSKAAGIARAELERLIGAALRCQRALAGLAGDSEAMVGLRRAVWDSCFGAQLERAPLLAHIIHDHDLLLLGETGTGKEAVARAVAAGQLATRGQKTAPFGAVNAAAIPETLIESSLFGHVRGAFTGALRDHPGQLRQAHGGSFFLDEVGELPPSTQAKLLRVMETNEVTPLGAERPVVADVRYVAATHKDLRAMVARGEFRHDLFQRLAGRVIELPPLRERPEDIPAIGLHFVQRCFPAGDPPSDSLARIEAFLHSHKAQRYAWPGNVRELQNVLRDMLLGLPPQGADLQTTEHEDRSALAGGPNGAVPPAIANATAPLREVEHWYMHHVIDKHGGNQSSAARALAIDRTTLRRRLGR